MSSQSSASLRWSLLILAGFLLQVVPAHGQDFVWAKQMGGLGFDVSADVALDSSGNIYTTGLFNGTADFDPENVTVGDTLTSAGSSDIFVSKLDGAGDFVWVKQMGGVSVDLASGVAVDASGNVYTTGRFNGTADFDPENVTVGDTLTSAGNADIFVCKLDSAGDFVWVKQMGGVSNDSARRVAVDGSGNAYTTGVFRGTADFDPENVTVGDTLTSAGNADIFVSKLDSAGDFVWVKQMGGVTFDVALGVVLDGSGNIYTTGRFQDTADFDPGADTFTLTSAGEADIFVSKLGPADSDGPIVSDVLADPDPVSISSGTTLTAIVDDSDTGNSDIASSDYEIRRTEGSVVASGSMAAQDSELNSPTETVETLIVAGTFTEAAVYEACVKGEDEPGNVGEETCAFLVVYDPTAGFVSGGGWVQSEAGYCQLDEACETAQGKANFGFISRYKQGAQTPTGETQFQFAAGNLNFHSDSYDWLVIAGPRAQYKGSGKINGVGD